MGTRLLKLWGCGNWKDHPHACGDKTRIDYISMTELGSSPRVWGQETYFDKAFNAARIIPTRVGTRHLFSMLAVTHRDHPHACGDKNACIRSLGATTGSSPRVWGQDVLSCLSLVYRGIIPTRVGTSAPAVF